MNPNLGFEVAGVLGAVFDFLLLVVLIFMGVVVTDLLSYTFSSKRRLLDAVGKTEAVLFNSTWPFSP
jgi:hypothetical protein